jgi:hypothetical protein
MNLNDLTTSPQLKFRAIHKETKKEGAVLGLSFDYEGKLEAVRVLLDVSQESDGFCDVDEEAWDAAICDVDLFIGQCDKDGKGIYGRDVTEEHHAGQTCYGIICFGRDYNGWYTQWLNHPSLATSMIIANETTKIIGNIHNLDALPEDVRRMLEN